MISKEKKFIFIHNFKTGGTSIEKKLGHFNSLQRDVQDHRTIREIEALTNKKEHFKKSLYAVKKGKLDRFPLHFSKAIQPELTKKQFLEYYKFTFIRNTWARVYSWYSNVMKDEIHRKEYGIYDDEYSYLAFLESKLNHETFGLFHFIKDSNGEIPMDFIGRFENLQEDFKIVCDKLDISDHSLPQLLKRNYTHYTEAYTPKTKDLVYNLYKEEIEYFNFEFGE